MSVKCDTARLNKLQKLEAKKPKRRCRTGTPRDGSWRPRFLAALRQLANIGYACEYARVSRTTAARHRERSAQFRAAWDNAIEEAVEKDELRLSDYANRGVPETVFLPSETLEEARVRWVKGPDGKVRAVPQKWRKQTYVERVVYKPSVTALIFRLKAYAPEKYREASQTHITNTPPQTAIAVKVETSIDRLPDAELDRILSQAAARGAFSAEALDQLQVAVPHLLPAAKGAGGDAAAPVAGDEVELEAAAEEEAGRTGGKATGAGGGGRAEAECRRRRRRPTKAARSPANLAPGQGSGTSDRMGAGAGQGRLR